MSEYYEFQGKTIDVAITDGLGQLGLNREQVDIEIITKGSRGIFGIGSEPAKVRIIPHSSPVNESSLSSVEVISTETDDAEVADGSVNKVEALSSLEKNETSLDAVLTDDGSDIEETTSSSNEEQPISHQEIEEDNEAVGGWEVDDPEIAEQFELDISDDELAAMAKDLLQEMIQLMDLDADVQANWKEPEDEDDESCLALNVYGDDLGSLIGRRGETLSSIQFLLRLMVNQKLRSWHNIVVDVENYKARRSEQLTQLAERMASQVMETGRLLSLEPMPSNERRVIHLALRNHPDVFTESTGDAERRKVHIIPRGK